MAEGTLRAQAKINLFLRVVGREASGYHHIETFFCRIALADVVQVRLTSGARALDCSGPEIPTGGLGDVDDNLAWRAAIAYCDRSGWATGFEIALDKHIPVRAGLAGGSADAGAVLRLLNALNPKPLQQEALQQMAVSLGADVAFLTQERSPCALARGRGDRLRLIPPLPARACVLAVPPIGVTTADAYAWIDEARGWTGQEVTPPDAAYPDEWTWPELKARAHNDFESVIFPRLPDVAAAHEYIRSIAGDSGIVRMSGSGSAIFGIMLAPPHSDTTLAAPNGIGTRVTTTVERVESVRLID